MHYEQPRALDTRRSLFIDIEELAYYIESILGSALAAPVAGLYLPNEIDPVMVAGREYWYEHPVRMDAHIEPGKLPIKFDPVLDHNGNIPKGESIYNEYQPERPWYYYQYDYHPVLDFTQVSTSPWDIVDRNPNDRRNNHIKKMVILPHHQAHLVQTRPNVPAVGIKLSKLLIQLEINFDRAYLPMKDRSVTFEETVFPFLNDLWQNAVMYEEREGVDHHGRAFKPFMYAGWRYLTKDKWFQDSIRLIGEFIQQHINPVQSVLRYDPYQIVDIHFSDTYQLRIDQLGDHRIQEWEVITSDPEYQRWLRARENGDWDRYVSEQEEISTNNYASAHPQNIYR